MASLLQDPLLEVSGPAPPPNKTFYHLSITKSEVIWRWWTISLRATDRNMKPGEMRQSHQKMIEDIRFQNEISIIFGQDVLEQAKSLCQGRFNYLEKVPDALLLRMMGFLELEDVGQLLHTSRRFWKLCQSEEFWENAVRQRCSTLLDEVELLAREIGWRRIFFTNKIQLQLIFNRWLRHQDTPRDMSGGTNDSDCNLHCPNPPLELTSSSEEDPELSVMKKFGGDLKRPNLSLSPDHSLSHCSPDRPSPSTSSSQEDPESLGMNEVLENLKELQLVQKTDIEEESDGLLPEPENIVV